MSCKDIGEYVAEYGRLADEVKNICTNKVCTLDTIQQILLAKGIEVNEKTLLTVIDQIEEMMKFDKEHTYDIGDAVTYIRGKIFVQKTIANLLVEISYKRFYLYDTDRYQDHAFREHIQSKLEFEIDKKITIDNESDLRTAVRSLNIPKENWPNYVYIKNDILVYCVVYNPAYCSMSKKYIGRIIEK